MKSKFQADGTRLRHSATEKPGPFGFSKGPGPDIGTDFVFLFPLGFPTGMAEDRLEWDQAQSRCHSQRLDAIIDLKLIVYVRQMEIDCSL